MTPPAQAPPELGYSEARRTVLAAQGIHRPRRIGPVGARAVRSVVDRLAVVQVDSVNVLARAHYLPAYSRLGAYETAHLDRLWNAAPRPWTEYWAHEASLVPEHLRTPLIALQRRTWMTPRGMDPQAHRHLAGQILDELSGRRPLTARQIEERLGDHGRHTGHWGWNWSVVKHVVEGLFATGHIASAGRNAQFERRLIPGPATGVPRAAARGRAVAQGDPAEGIVAEDGTVVPVGGLPDRHEAAIRLVGEAARALGVATEASLADYYRILVADAAAAARELHSAGVLEPVRLPAGAGRSVPAWRHAGATTPRHAAGRALVSPFDPLVFHRPRVEHLFGVRYRLGIYTPAPRRTRGYYSLLFLLGERLVGQVDLKAERRAGVLIVKGAWSELGAAVPDADRADLGDRRAGVGPVVDELSAELGEMAAWLGLSEVVVSADAPGDLAAGLERMHRNYPAG